MPIRLVAGPTSDEQDAGAIRWAAENGAWIISNSWGPPDGAWFIQGDEVVYPLPDIVRDAIDWAADNGRSGKGCVVVWAAGNGNEPVGYDGYASYDKVLAVGACTDQGQRSYYSDYGSELDLCAPSDGGRTSGIWTTDLSGTAGYNAGSASFGDAAGNYYSAFGGTSSAAPLVAGAAALLLSREPELTREEVMQRITGTADRVDIAHAGYDLNGHSLWYGHGRVNTCSALTGRTRHPQLSISAVPGAVRSGDTPALSFQLLRGRDTRANGGAVYLVVVPPWGGMLFVRPDYGLTEDAFPFVRRVVAVDMSGSIGPGVPLAGAPPGLYTIYAGIVANGGDPYSPASWMHTPASALLSVTP
jgi:subtilisin family serine protease